jgi:putative ATPase
MSGLDATRLPIMTVSPSPSATADAMSTKRQADVVTCPVCERTVPAAEINLHLDLRCPGPGAGPSSPLPASGTQRSLVDLTQPETPAARAPAPMFRSRPASQSNGKMGVKRSAPSEPAREEKKPRVNALKAAQP